MTDRELLALAAIVGIDGAPKHLGVGVLDWVRDCRGLWNPLEDDGDALRLAVKLRLVIDADLGEVLCPHEPARGVHYAAPTNTESIRRAIVRAAAALAS